MLFIRATRNHYNTEVREPTHRSWFVGEAVGRDHSAIVARGTALGVFLAALAPDVSLLCDPKGGQCCG